MPDANNTPHGAESLDEQLDHAAEELITGDSDDPPLSEERVAEMLRVSWNTSAAKELPSAQGRFEDDRLGPAGALRNLSVF
jgi:hypothetical protein